MRVKKSGNCRMVRPGLKCYFGVHLVSLVAFSPRSWGLDRVYCWFFFFFWRKRLIFWLLDMWWCEFQTWFRGLRWQICVFFIKYAKWCTRATCKRQNVKTMNGSGFLGCSGTHQSACLQSSPAYIDGWRGLNNCRTMWTGWGILIFKSKPAMEVDSVLCYFL